jgi:hypothetical protein
MMIKKLGKNSSQPKFGISIMACLSVILIVQKTVFFQLKENKRKTSFFDDDTFIKKLDVNKLGLDESSAFLCLRFWNYI